MRVAILESIVMPAGHEVEFDRILINELKRQGHEPVLFVPENFPFKVDYGVDIVYLEGGEVVTYAGASKWKKPFLSILRERRRRSWFTSAAEKITEHNIDALIIPTGTYRYIKALLDTPLKDSKAAVHVIFHGIGKKEMDRFIKQAHRANAYKNVYLDVISLRDDMLRPNLPRIRKILPPVFLPSSELNGEQGNCATQGNTSIQDKKDANSTNCIGVNLETPISTNKPIKLGFFGQFRKEKNIERFIDAFVSLNYDDSVQLVVQGATVKPEDGILFESIIKKYNQYSNIKFIHASLIGKDWDTA
ncbi:MAG: glycosyltransferase family 1 protein, partial [Veillonella sp.]|nr:glycosyltransferase family 1 protein [Veillonella sp.]